MWMVAVCHYPDAIITLLFNRSTTNAIATFMGQQNNAHLSTDTPQRRWQNAIRRIIIRTNVRKMALQLAEIEESTRARMMITMQSAADVLKATLIDKDGPSPPVFLKLPPILKTARSRLCENPPIIEDPAEHNISSTDLLSHTEKVQASFRSQKSGLESPSVISSAEKVKGSFRRQQSALESPSVISSAEKVRSQSNAHNFRCNMLKPGDVMTSNAGIKSFVKSTGLKVDCYRLPIKNLS